MTAYKLSMRNGGVIPPAITLGVVLRPRQAEAAKAAPAAAAAEAPQVPLPIGSDPWYNPAVIPFQEYDGQVSEPTPAAEYGIDDAVAWEGDIAGVLSSGGFLASAWWEIRPTHDCLLTVDTWLTTGGLKKADNTTPAVYPTDTNLWVLTTDEDPAPVPPYPSAGTDFDLMIPVASSDDSPDPDDPDRPYTSKVTDVALAAGKVYWIRCDTWGGEASPGTMYGDGITFKLRVSIRFV